MIGAFLGWLALGALSLALVGLVVFVVRGRRAVQRSPEELPDEPFAPVDVVRTVGWSKTEKRIARKGFVVKKVPRSKKARGAQ